MASLSKVIASLTNSIAFFLLPVSFTDARLSVTDAVIITVKSVAGPGIDIRSFGREAVLILAPVPRHIHEV